MELINLILVLSAFFIYWDCTRNNIGKNPAEKGILNNSAGVWAVGTYMLWIVVLPLYLLNRKKLKAKALDAPQKVSPLRRNVILGLLLAISGLIVVGQFPNDNIPNRESLLSDISGLWKTSDGVMVMIDFKDFPEKKIKIRDTVYPVIISQVDLENDRVAVTVTLDDVKNVWTIQKNIEPDESFQLVLTLANGVQEQLFFVRNNL